MEFLKNYDKLNKDDFNFENVSQLSWSNLNEFGIVNRNTEIINHAKFEKIIDLESVNTFLFGTKNELKYISNFDLISRDLAVRINDKMFLISKKIRNYLKFLFQFNSQIENDYTLIPFNYYIIINKLSNGKYIQNNIKEHDIICLVLKDFTEWLNKDSSVEAKLFSECIFKDSKFQGFYVTDPLVRSNMFISSIGFNDNIGNTFYISLSNGFNDKSKISIDMKSELEPQFLRLYEFIKEQILLKDLRSYTINNLTHVIGNLKIATMIYDSKSDKENYIINIKDIESILPFNENFIENRLKFIDEYKGNNNYKIKYINDDEIVYLNFNGLQDFLLSIDKKYLISESFIKDIRQFYKDIMEAFIEILEERYNEIL